MKLADLIRGNHSVRVATAIPAIPATDGQRGARTVAGIATVAVANSANSNADHASRGRHWRLHLPDRAPFDLILSDDLARAEVMALRPDAVDAEPVTCTHRPATAAEAEELHGLVNAVLTAPADRAEAMRAGLGDIEAALTCYRALAVAAGTAVSSDVEPTDMRSCRQCAALTWDGYCLQAAKGVPLGYPVARKYQPTMPDRPQRCAGYLPGPDDPDQRTGAQRWAWMLRAKSAGTP